VLAGSSEREILLTLFDLGRQVASVIDFDELLERIPDLIRRLLQFDAFAVYLFDERHNTMSVAYAVGYPTLQNFRLMPNEGIIGRVVTTQQTVVIGDVETDPRYIAVVPGMKSTIAVPLVHKKKTIGALNILSRERDRYTDRDASILWQFAALVASALVNARLFEQQRLDAGAFETLARIGREVAAVLDLDDLLSHVVELTRHVIDYRTFGILLLNEETKELEIKVAVQYGEKVVVPKVPLGEGLVGYAALHREAVNVPDVSQDPRYIRIVDDVRSELAVPKLV
jgi:sigma-B regulation protein RsbU (phosphoserine phosphatase)